MKILVTGLSMAYLSGQPLYCYELCRELNKQGHTVTMMSELHIPPGQRPDNDGFKLLDNLRAEGIECIEWNDNLCSGFDLILASEPQSALIFRTSGDTPVFNIVHSEYECESPIPNRPEIKAYICIRPSIAAHILTQHNIPSDKVKVIYNGVDRLRFDTKLCIKSQDKDFYRIVIPCTLDKLREKFLNHMIDSATANRRIDIYGMDCGADLHSSPYITIFKDTFDIQEAMFGADEVAGILLGRVNLEAWSMGIKSTIFDPVTLENITLDPPKDFNKKHNIVNVVKQIIKLYDDFIRG